MCRRRRKSCAGKRPVHPQASNERSEPGKRQQIVALRCRLQWDARERKMFWSRMLDHWPCNARKATVLDQRCSKPYSAATQASDEPQGLCSQSDRATVCNLLASRTWLSLRLAATNDPRPASLNGSRRSAKLTAVSAFVSRDPLTLGCVGVSAPSSSHAVSIR